MFDYCLYSQIISFLVHYMNICEVGVVVLSYGILCSVFVEVCLGTFLGSEFQLRKIGTFQLSTFFLFTINKETHYLFSIFAFFIITNERTLYTSKLFGVIVLPLCFRSKRRSMPKLFFLTAHRHQFKVRFFFPIIYYLIFTSADLEILSNMLSL